MNNSVFFTSTAKILFRLAALTAAGTLIVPAISAAPAAKPAEKREEAPSGAEWKDAGKYQRTLARRIAANFKTWKPAEVEKFIKTSEGRVELASWELIRAAGAEEISKMAKKSSGRKFLAAFAGDPDWIEGFLYSAPPKNAMFSVKLLQAFAEKDPEIKTVPVLKKLATAVAGEFARNSYSSDPKRIFRRYKLYASGWREKKLNPLFDQLDYWDMRITAGFKGNNPFGNEESLRWGRDNVKLPEAGYASGRDIFQMPYRLWNKVGDSVHTDDYYRPFGNWYKGNQLKITQEVGAVCGGVSHYGASAACANGIPGITMGEPGHCAFAVRVQGKWRDNNSISWERGCHWTLWNEHDWAFLILTQKLYEDVKNTPPSFRIATLARLAGTSEKLDPEIKFSLYRYALEKQPLNFPVWVEYLNVAKKEKAKDKNFWVKTHKEIVDAFCPDLPNVGAVVLGKYVYPTLLPLCENDAERAALFLAFWDKVEGFGPARWNFEAFWTYQTDSLGEGANAKTYEAFGKNYNAEKPRAPGNDSAKRNFREKLKKSLAGKQPYVKPFEKWENGTPRK